MGLGAKANLLQEAIGLHCAGSPYSPLERPEYEVRTKSVVLGACILALVVEPVRAQDHEELGSRLFRFESSFLVTQGLGEFGDLTGQGLGVTVGSAWMPSRTSDLGVRIDLSVNVYDRETNPSCLTNPCWIEGDVVTSYGSFQFGIGPEWTITDGAVESYVFATVGRSVISTSLGLEICGNYDSSYSCSVEEDRNYHSDWGPVIRSGAGLRYQFRRFFGGYLSVVHQHFGTRLYMVKGDLSLNDDGTVTIDTKRRSSVSNLGFEVGVYFGLPFRVRDAWR